MTWPSTPATFKPQIVRKHQRRLGGVLDWSHWGEAPYRSALIRTWRMVGVMGADVVVLEMLRG